MGNILIIDDNPTNRETFADVLGGEGHTVLTAGTGEEGLAKLTGAAVDAVLCDLKLPGLDGLGTMELAHERHGKLPWILVTGHGSEDLAVQAIKQGAFNYLTKPVDLARLKATVEGAVRLASANRENKELRRELGYDEALDRIVGASHAIKQVKAMIRQVAASDATVLIEGESGTGKELVADALTALSRRAGRPYFKLNTAAIPRELLESELFGHERGAFTGAVGQKKGVFEAADTGTLFLDEIGEMPMDAQVKLLRVLQDGSFHRVGGTASIGTDVRLITATNRNLKQEVLAGAFRMDLYFRLNVVNLHVPALRERREDIPLLAKDFLERLNRRHGQRRELSDATVQALLRLDWPGNVRELENTIEKLYVLASSRVIGPEGLALDADRSWRPGAATARPAHPGGATVNHPAAAAPATATGTGRDSARGPASAPATAGADAKLDPIQALVGLPVDEVERRLILATLDHCRGNKSKAARLLQIGLKTLYRKLEAYGLAPGNDEAEAAGGAAAGE